MTDITEALKNRVLVLDGAMGTMIQRLELDEADFRGSEFAGWPSPLKGCNDLLCLTRPGDIAAIHRQYLEAGADIIETNTFNANAISMADYGLQDRVRDINLAGARIARQAAGVDAWVAGSMGPTNVSLSMPTGHSQTFDSMAEAYFVQASALIEGGVDLLLVETVFDPINAKAAVAGIRRAMEESGRELPLMISATLTETGRLLSGQTLPAFVTAIEFARPLSVGLNCGFGADIMSGHLPMLAGSPYYVSAHPNAGLPDEMGCYVETSDKMAADVGHMLDNGLVNIVGGCCGTTPDHIKAIARLARKAVPRVPRRDDSDGLRLSGLEEMRQSGFLKVGERCNVAGSRKFLRLVKEGNTGEAIDIAAAQIDKGAAVIDVNMDDGMLDARAEMERFVSALGSDARTAPVPVMIDSSDMDVITAALKRLPGKSIVNSISLKEGEDAFIAHARAIRDLGAAVVVMAFDEKGQADNLQRRTEICGRAYRILTEKVGFAGRDIVFDPNVLTVATGIEAHNNYALDFLDATAWIRANLPGAKVSGGISNLSFAFRGNNRLREAMHTLFIAHAMDRGMEMAIVNPATSLDPSTIDRETAEAIDYVLFNRHPDATQKLLDVAARMVAETGPAVPAAKSADAAAQKSVVTLEEMIVKGNADGIEKILADELERHGTALAVIDNCLMAGMNRVGELFGAGKMFLPQVVRSATVMKRAVEILTPRIEAENAGSPDSAVSGRKMVIATVKGDVHDIGKNIVAVVMRCSGFNVIDLGVMVPAREIIEAAKRENADLVGLSGLITPSLREMAEVASLMQAEGLTVPLCVGGATTSAMHTAVKLAPLYSGGVVHTSDAASLPRVATLLANPALRDAALAEIAVEQQRLRRLHEGKIPALSLEEARARGEGVERPAPAPGVAPGVYDYVLAPEQVADLINWRAFLGEWSMNPAEDSDESRRLIADARKVIEEFAGQEIICARVVVCGAHRTENDEIVINDGELVLPMARALEPNSVTGRCLALSDFVAPADDHIALFAVTAKLPVEGTTDYHDMMRQIVAHRLAEASTEWLHRRVCTELWGLPERSGIRPAVGYPSLPDQSLIFRLDELIRYRDLGIALTSTGAMNPSASTSGLIILHPSARYFTV